MEEREKVVCEMDSAPDEIEVPQGTTFEWHKQDDSRIATAGPSPILPMTCNTTEISPTEWQFVTYREIPYEPGDFWDELRNQSPVRNIVVTSSRLRALNPRIFTDFDENADKRLMEHDETETVPQESSDNIEEYAATSVLNEETSPINYNRQKKSQSSYSCNCDSEMELSPDSVSSKDSDFSLNSSLLSSDSDSESWANGRSKKTRGKRARRRTNRIESSSGSSDLLDEILSGRKSPEDSDEFSLNTSSISDSSVSWILESDDDLF